MSAVVDMMLIYEGSDSAATKALYDRLAALGPAGAIATNVFRAMKASERAKKYRGGNGHGSYRGQAYEKKQWSMGLLADALTAHANSIGLTWGWAEDDEQTFHRWVLYVDLPTGQVSFHTSPRGDGPVYPGQWDRVTGAGPYRICRWIAALLEKETSDAVS
jgi:hypothetical protein